VADTDAEAQAPEVEDAVGTPAPPERHGVPVRTDTGTDVLFPPVDDYLRVVEALKDEGFALCVDVTAVDYLTHPGRPVPEGVTPERYEVVVNLLSFERRERVRVRVQVPQADPVVPSLFALHPGTEAPEREVYDMFGIAFADHPDLTRILMPEDWEGHPLRKDFAVGRIPVQFKAVGGGK
jgi:NADH-quinone oxidoreductase subunit C